MESFRVEIEMMTRKDVEWKSSGILTELWTTCQYSDTNRNDYIVMVAFSSVNFACQVWMVRRNSYHSVFQLATLCRCLLVVT